MHGDADGNLVGADHACNGKSVGKAARYALFVCLRNSAVYLCFYFAYFFWRDECVHGVPRRLRFMGIDWPSFF